MSCNKQESSVQTTAHECYLKISDLLWSLQISYNNYLCEYNLLQSQRNILHGFSISYNL